MRWECIEYNADSTYKHKATYCASCGCMDISLNIYDSDSINELTSSMWMVYNEIESDLLVFVIYLF